MSTNVTASPALPEALVYATGEQAVFTVGDKVQVMTRSPIGHYRVPNYLRGRRGTVQQVIEPKLLDNEREGFGLNAGDKRHYYRVAFPLAELFPAYPGPAHDNLRIEVFEAWLERI